jgi:hypothetical protein
MNDKTKFEIVWKLCLLFMQAMTVILLSALLITAMLLVKGF